MKQRILSVIMGGGRGTRLHPLTKQRCKPAVPLAGKYRLVDIPISNCLNAGFNQIYVLTQFNTASLHRHIQESYKFDHFGGGFVEILAAEQTETGESWYQGTADAVRQNLHHFAGGRDDLVIILSGDQLYRMDLSDIVAQHRRTGAHVTIAAKATPARDVSSLGVMRVGDELAVSEFVEKPTDPAVIQSLHLNDTILEELGKTEPHCLASMGIYVFNRATLEGALDNEMDDFGKEIIPSLLGRVPLHAYAFDGYWEDIGTVRSFFDANLALTDPNPTFDFYDSRQVVYTHARFLPAARVTDSQVDRAVIADGCRINGAKIRRSMIGVRSTIEDGSVVDHVVMMGADFFDESDEAEEDRDTGTPSLGIGCNCVIRNAIIDKNARIGNNVRLDPSGVEDGNYCGDAVTIRDGVLIVLKSAVVPDGTVI